MRRSSTRSQTRSVIELHARQMRSWLTPSEQKLWSAISAGQLGVQFRRQVPLGRFIADFVAPVAGLVVEVDGRFHSRRRVADARRDRALARMGYRVLRLEAELVETELEVAVARVREALGQTEVSVQPTAFLTHVVAVFAGVVPSQNSARL